MTATRFSTSDGGDGGWSGQGSGIHLASLGCVGGAMSTPVAEERGELSRNEGPHPA